MIKFLTAAIGVVAKGRAAKAIAGGLSTAGVGFELWGPPLGEAFAKGFAGELVPAVTQLGAAVGGFVATYLVGHVVTWLAPKNAD